jgi:hypothetical protein
MTEAERALERSLLAVIEHEREVGIQIGKLSRENGSDELVEVEWQDDPLISNPYLDLVGSTNRYQTSSASSPQAQPSRTIYYLYTLAGLLTGAAAVGVYTVA